MSYATPAQVRSRAGRAGDGWTAAASTRPNEDDVVGYLDDVSSEFDALIAARGFAVPTTGPVAAALRGATIDGALVLALEATFPGGIPAERGGLYESARTRYLAAWTSLADGTFPALALLESSPASPSASSFWLNEPEYGTVPIPSTSPDANRWIAPRVLKGMSL